MQEEYGNKVVFVIADVETPEGYELAMQYDVTGIPAFFCLDAAGRTAEKLVGFRNDQPLRDALERLLP